MPPDPSLLGSFTIPPTHPALPGHFPNHPVVPGVVLLDHALALLGNAAIASVKFLRPVLPGEKVEVLHQPGLLLCRSGGHAVLRARLAAP